MSPAQESPAFVATLIQDVAGLIQDVRERLLR
jgi:hypothetical protein